MNIYHYCMIFLLLCLLILEGIRWFSSCPDKREEEGIDIAKSMTIGSRETQEDQAEVARTPAGVMAVLADGSGQTYGGRIAAKTATQTCMDIFHDYNAFHNPQYFFRKAFHSANKEILKALGVKICR